MIVFDNAGGMYDLHATEHGTGKRSASSSILTDFFWAGIPCPDSPSLRSRHYLDLESSTDIEAAMLDQFSGVLDYFDLGGRRILLLKLC